MPLAFPGIQKTKPGKYPMGVAFHIVKHSPRFVPVARFSYSLPSPGEVEGDEGVSREQQSGPSVFFLDGPEQIQTGCRFLFSQG